MSGKFFLIFLLLSFQLGFSQEKPFDIKTDKDYTHTYTKTVFPKFWNGFIREQLRCYDKHCQDIGASYVQQREKNDRTVISIYIYPNSRPDNQNLREQFQSFQEAININAQEHIEIKPQFAKISDDKVIVNSIYALFKNKMGQPDFFKGVKYSDKNSFISIYESGGWNLKIRMSGDKITDEQVKEMAKRAEVYFQPLEIAKIKPIPIENAPDIILSPSVKRDSMMIYATIEAANAKISWLKDNINPKELVAGFNDMNINSEEFSVKEMLKFYENNKTKWTMTDETKRYFEEISRIVAKDMTKDFIYHKYDGIIDYPEGESRKELYTDFRIKEDINEWTNELMYKVFYNLK